MFSFWYNHKVKFVFRSYTHSGNITIGNDGAFTVAGTITHFYITRYIPYMWMKTPYAFDIPCIYLYISCIYHVYTLCIHADIACTSCFQGFVALIAQTRRPLMAQRTTRQINTMRLILISPIHNQCWKHSYPSCRNRQMMNTSHYLSSLTVFQTLPVLTRPNP